MDKDQRLKMIEDLLASNGAAYRQQFAHHRATPSSTAADKSIIRPLLTHPLRGKQNPIAYLRRLNGEARAGGMVDDKNKTIPAILLPHFNVDIAQNPPTNARDAAMFYEITHAFFTQGTDQQCRDLSRHNVLRFVFYLLNTHFLFDNANLDKYDALLTNIAMKLYDLNEQFLRNVAVVKFNPVVHEYYVNGQNMELSVTKSLDRLFGQFNSNEAAARMVKSRNWKRNSLFTAINYDENYQQRSEEEMCRLIQQEWQKRCDRGTLLHEFINHSLTRSASHTDKGTAETAPADPDRQGNSGLTSQEDNAGRRAADNEARVGGFVVEEPIQQSVDRRCRFLWKTLQRRFCSEPALRAQGVNNRRKNKPSGDDADRVVLSKNKKNAAKASLASINLLDDANVLAFTRWNQMRLNDHWLLLASEYTVYDTEAGIAGTIDAIFLPYPHRPDMVVLVDWKRSDLDFGTRYYGPNMCYEHEYTRRYPKCNYWKYAFQLNIYREILERAHEGRLIVLDMMIVNFLADSEFPRTFSVPRIPETRLFLDDLRHRQNNSKVVPLDSILTPESAPI